MGKSGQDGSPSGKDGQGQGVSESKEAKKKVVSNVIINNESKSKASKAKPAPTAYGWDALVGEPTGDSHNVSHQLPFLFVLPFTYIHAYSPSPVMNSPAPPPLLQSPRSRAGAGPPALFSAAAGSQTALSLSAGVAV
jgi:hypothetical protein